MVGRPLRCEHSLLGVTRGRANIQPTARAGTKMFLVAW